MIETKEKDIDGHLYSVSQFPARRALKIKTRLIKLIAPSLFALIGDKKGLNAIMETDIATEGLNAAINELVNKLDENHVVDLILEMLSMTRRDGKELKDSHFDMVYAGNFAELYKALRFVLEVNFGNFFQALNIGSEQLSQINLQGMKSTSKD